MLMQNQPIAYDKLRDILMEVLGQNRQTPVTPVPRPNNELIGQLTNLFTGAGILPGTSTPLMDPGNLSSPTKGGQAPSGTPTAASAGAPTPEKTPIPGIDTPVALPRGHVGAGREYYHQQLQKLYPDIYNAQNNWQLPKFKIGTPFNNQNSGLYDLYMASLGRGRF